MAKTLLNRFKLLSENNMFHYKFLRKAYKWYLVFKVEEIVNIFKCRYNMVRNNTIWKTAMQWVAKVKHNQIVNSQ